MTPTLRATQAASAPIPFRSDAAGTGGMLVHALLVTVLLLGACLVLALHARKRGWLARWSIAPAATQAVGRMQVVDALKLSQRTTVFKVRDGQREFLVVESSVRAGIAGGMEVATHAAE